MKIIVNGCGQGTDFGELKIHVAFLDSIKKREISMEEAWHKQEECNRYLTKIRIGNKSEKQKRFANERNNAIRFVYDYGSTIFEAKRKAAEEEPEPEPSIAKATSKNFY